MAVFTRLCLQSGENVISGMIYALLGVSAMTRVGHARFCSLIIITSKFYQSSTPCSGDLSTLNKVVYKLLQVHKATTILQQLSAWCYLSGSRDSKSLNWSSLQSWLIAAVSLVPKLQCSTSPFCLFLKWFKNALGMSLETICQNMVLFLLCSASSYLCEPIFSKSKWPVNSGSTVVFMNAPRECWGYAISTNVV